MRHHRRCATAAACHLHRRWLARSHQEPTPSRQRRPCVSPPGLRSFPPQHPTSAALRPMQPLRAQNAAGCHQRPLRMALRQEWTRSRCALRASPGTRVPPERAPLLSAGYAHPARRTSVARSCNAPPEQRRASCEGSSSSALRNAAAASSGFSSAISAMPARSCGSASRGRSSAALRASANDSAARPNASCPSARRHSSAASPGAQMSASVHEAHAAAASPAANAAAARAAAATDATPGSTATPSAGASSSAGAFSADDTSCSVGSAASACCLLRLRAVRSRAGISTRTATRTPQRAALSLVAAAHPWRQSHSWRLSRSRSDCTACSARRAWRSAPGACHVSAAP